MLIHYIYSTDDGGAVDANNDFYFELFKTTTRTKITSKYHIYTYKKYILDQSKHTTKLLCFCFELYGFILQSRIFSSI